MPETPSRPSAYPYDAALLSQADRLGLIPLLGRHFVSMVIGAESPDGQAHRLSLSAFVVEFEDVWYLMSAGHNIERLRAQVRAGLRIVAWDLNDAFAGGPHRQTMTPGLALDQWEALYSESIPSGIDIAAVYIHEFNVRTMRANGVVPLQLGEDFVRLGWHPYDQLALTGISAETSQFAGTRLHQLLYVIPVGPLDPHHVVPALLEGNEPRVYGVILGDGWDSAGLTTIDGTSGGPVFGIWLAEGGRTFDYAAVGIQSGWDRPSKQIAAWPLDVLSKAIAHHGARG